MSSRRKQEILAPPLSKAAREAKTTCRGKTAAGKRCPARGNASGYCYWHDPNVSQAAKDAARRRGGALSRDLRRPQNVEPADLSTEDKARGLLEETVDLVRGGKLSPSVANAVAKIVATGLRLGELKLASKLTEIEARLKASAPATKRRR